MLQSQNASQDPQGDNSKKQRSSKATGACQNVIVTSILTHRGPGTIVGVMEPQTLHVRVAPWCALPHTSSSSYLLPCGPFLIPTAGCIMYSQSQPPPSFCAPVEMFLSIHIIKPCCNQLTDEGMVEQLLAVLEWHVALLELETEYYDLCNRVTIQLTIIPHAGIQLIGNQILTFCQPRRVPS